MTCYREVAKKSPDPSVIVFYNTIETGHPARIMINRSDKARSYLVYYRLVRGILLFSNFSSRLCDIFLRLPVLRNTAPRLILSRRKHTPTLTSYINSVYIQSQRYRSASHYSILAGLWKTLSNISTGINVEPWYNHHSTPELSNDHISISKPPLSSSSDDWCILFPDTTHLRAWPVQCPAHIGNQEPSNIRTDSPQGSYCEALDSLSCTLPEPHLCFSLPPPCRQKTLHSSLPSQRWNIHRYEHSIKSHGKCRTL